MDGRTAGQLLAAYERGESAAFEALVDRYEGPLLRYARCLCGDAAEELANRPPGSFRLISRDETATVYRWEPADSPGEPPRRQQP